MNFIEKMNNFIKFLEYKFDCKYEFYNYECNEERAFVKVVPYNFGIYKIPDFEKYCKMIGLEITSNFRKDEERNNGYYEYHECYLKDNGEFLNKNYSELIE